MYPPQWYQFQILNFLTLREIKSSQPVFDYSSLRFKSDGASDYLPPVLRWLGFSQHKSYFLAPSLLMLGLEKMRAIL